MTAFPDSEQIESRILHELAGFRNARVLEVGFGDGRMARHYRAETQVTVGLDTDFDELRTSRDDRSQAQSKVRLAQAQAEALPFTDQSFDLILLGWSL